MEYLYHVDAEDNVVGKIARQKAHDKLLKHRTGITFLIDSDGRIFLTKRSTNKEVFPNCYDASSSYHVSYGETYHEAARREAKEELGIDKPLQPLGTFSHCDPPSNHIVAVFKIEYAGEAIALDPLEMKEGAFYTIKEVEKIVAECETTPWLRDGWRLLKGKI